MATVCAVCEKRPPSPDDVMCGYCRGEFNARCEIVNDPVAIVLNHHQHLCALSDIDSTMCMCGERFEGGPGNYRGHVSALIYEALGIDGPPKNQPLRELN